MKPVIFLPVLLVIVAGCTAAQQPELHDQAPAPQTHSYTPADIAGHSAASDCWLAIHGKVYNVTEFIPAHPGGQAIVQGCGTDATELFETRPMGSGTPHSLSARGLLSDYYIGDLVTESTA